MTPTDKPILSFDVRGLPITAGSKTIGRTKDGRMFVRPEQGQKGTNWMRLVGQVASETFAGQPVILGPVSLRLEFRFLRPRGHYRTGKNAHLLRPSARLSHTTKPDLSKLTRAIEDALTGIVWRNDSQVNHHNCHKRYAIEGEGTGVNIAIFNAGTNLTDSLL